MEIWAGQPWIHSTLKVEGARAEIVIGSFTPEHAIDQMQWLLINMALYINVGDSPGLTYAMELGHHPRYWFPVIENKPWPIESLFGIAKTLSLYRNRQKIFIHCGPSYLRSKAILAIWMLSRRLDRDPSLKIVGLDLSDWEDVVDLGRISKWKMAALRLADEKPGMSLGDILSKIDNRWIAHSQEPEN